MPLPSSFSAQGFHRIRRRCTPRLSGYYARDDSNEGMLHCNGTLAQAADRVFLKLFADGKLIDTISQQATTRGSYAFQAKLKPGLIRYSVELVAKTGKTETVLY